ncbi:protein translocase subunit SecD [Patescibacteria group bacterium]|nr:protein translocase subunit SecD [Patescibacteria group bacterium]
MKAKNLTLFIIVLALTILAVFFVYPKPPIGGYLSQHLPWRMGLDLVGGSYLVYEVDMTDVTSADRGYVMDGLRDVIEERVNLFGVAEPRVTASQSGDDYRLNVELAGVKDIKEAIKQIGETPFLQFAEIGEIPDSVSTSTPVESEFIFSDLNGRFIKSAHLNFTDVGLPLVSIEFDSEGSELFEQLTTKNVGKPLAIFLDNNLISAPRVNEPISGGRAQITGIDDIKEAKKLVERFNAGALPAPVTLINQQTISASLGQDSLEKTLWAGIWGTLAIMLFMLFYYQGLGLFACIALFIYIALTLAVFKLFSVTMTLAGIAGFVLSIGMAIDANILIFERTKEEVRKGSRTLIAIEEGFKRAWTSIRDSNLTTILTALILYNLTSGFVKGFALTLLIGVIISMFTAITVTKNLLKIFYAKDN